MESTNQDGKLYCKECFAELKEGTRICPDCGTKVGEETPTGSKNDGNTIEQKINRVKKIGEIERKGVISFLCGLLSLLFVWDGAALVLLIAAFGFGISANVKAKREKLPNSSYAGYGILLAVITLLVAGILTIKMVSLAKETGATINWFSCRAFNGLS